jgi:HAE1 family hydrophobic/amphiphilic exporter-1
MMAVIMLVGIVVNNAIVLVDYVNFLRKDQELSLVEAVVETSRRRLRPILMTTITTLFGVIPLAMASGDGHELWQPIGTTMVGGLALSSSVTLILIPCMYVSFERFRRKDRFDRRRAAEAATESARVPDSEE